MAIFGRLPAEIRARIGREHVLGWGTWQASRFELGHVVATNLALHLIKSVDGVDSVLPWDIFVSASWNEPQLDVVVQQSAGEPPVRRSLTLPEPGHVPEAVRDRVTSSIVFSTQLALVGDRGARFTARRVPGTPELRWSVVFDPGLDSSDPDLRGAAEARLADLRTQLGA